MKWTTYKNLNSIRIIKKLCYDAFGSIGIRVVFSIIEKWRLEVVNIE